MLGCIIPISSPMMNRMLGFCCCCAAAGMLAAVIAAIEASKPSHKFRDRLIVRLLEVIHWLVYRGRRIRAVHACAARRLGYGLNPAAVMQALYNAVRFLPWLSPSKL